MVSQKNKKALIIGVTGFVGSHVAFQLIKNGYDVHCIIRSESHTSRITALRSHLSLHEASLTNKPKLRQIITSIKPNYIFHLAAEGIFGGMEADAKKTVETNFLGTINLLQCLDDISYQIFVNTGSSSEYGPKKRAMKESDKCEPESTYAISKLASTLYCKSYAEKANKPIVTLRLFSPYGPSDSKERFIQYALSKIYNNSSLIIENPKGTRDYIYIEDVVRAYMSCINNSTEIKGKIINIGSGQQTSVSHILKLIEKITSKTIQINIKLKIRKYESTVWKADISEAKKLLNWNPKVTIEEGLKATYDWIRQQ